MALLNEEIDLFESILAQGADPIPLYSTYPTDPPAIPPPGSLNVNQRVRMAKESDPNPFTRFASIDTGDRKGSLLLVNDYFDFAPYQPNQMAMNDLKLNVPARESAQAWLISPGGVEAARAREKVPGGVRFNVPDYGPTALVLVTTDLTLPERIRRQIERVRPLAVQLAIEQARAPAPPGSPRSTAGSWPTATGSTTRTTPRPRSSPPACRLPQRRGPAAGQVRES